MRDGAGRQLVLDLQHPFQHDLACQVNIDLVLEDDIDHREADLGERAHLDEARGSGQLEFKGEGDEPFDLFRGQSRRFGHDLDQHGGDVGEGIDRNRLEGIEPAEGECEGDDDDQNTLAEGQLQQRGYHVVRSAIPTTRI